MLITYLSYFVVKKINALQKNDVPGVTFSFSTFGFKSKWVWFGKVGVM